MTKTQFINQTLIPYFTGKKKFGYDKELESCCYRTAEGHSCAVGQYIPDSLYNKSMEGDWLDDVINISEIKEFAHLSSQEWSAVQWLHDAGAVGDALACSHSLEILKLVANLPLKKLTRIVNEYIERQK